MNQPNQPERKQRTTPVVSLRTRTGEAVEMVYRPDLGESRLVTFCDGDAAEHTEVERDGHIYVPYSNTNNLLTHRVLLLPSQVGSYESDETLAAKVKAFIHKYVDLSETFEEIATHYVLLTWQYDRWNELPYLRVRGDFGSGKSRFLLTVGSICWKPIMASGASTVSPIFRLLDQVGGTLVVDEADFWASDERAEIVKILNNGNARGFPVLRSEVTPSKEFSPRAFNIFGPKIIATRHPFEDEALESRCLTEVLGTRPVRPDIPVNLPQNFEGEAEELRNMLLRYRFNRLDAAPEAGLETDDAHVASRRRQIITPMLATATSAAVRERIRSFVEPDRFGRREVQRRLIRHVLSAVRAIAQTTQIVTVGAVAERLRTGAYSSLQQVSDKSVGTMLREIGMEPQKSNGLFRLMPSDMLRLEELFKQYHVGDVGDVGDVQPGATAEA